MTIRAKMGAMLGASLTSVLEYFETNVLEKMCLTSACPWAYGSNWAPGH